MQENIKKTIEQLQDNFADKLIDKLIDTEFAMFQHVQGSHGRASCQNDPKTFHMMRKAQFCTWSVEVLESYEADLERAGQEGRNMPEEKYAFMMESTHPVEFVAIAHLLPRLSASKIAMRESIVATYMIWERQLLADYPYIKAQGRPSFSHEDIVRGTSVETYLRGELSTYSMATLMLLDVYTKACAKQARNLAFENLAYISKCYGHESVEKAEEWAKQRVLQRA